MNKFTKLIAAIALLAVLTIPLGMRGQNRTVTLTQTNLGLTGSYTSDTEKTIDEITYVYTDLMKNGENIQAKASTGTIRNTSAYPNDIISVAIIHSGTARATTINGSADGTNWTQVATGSGSITADFSGKGYKYFQINRGSNAAYWTQIVVTYSDGGTTTTDPTLTAASSVSVPNQVENQYDGNQYATLDVEGSNLTDNATIALNGGDNSNFEMSTNSGTWASSLTLEQSGGSFSSEVAIRLKDNLVVGDYNDVITISSEGATNVTVNVSGSVTTPPTYTVTYNSHGGSGTMTDENSPYLAGVEVTLLENTFTAPEDMIWDSWQVKDASDNDVTVSEGKFTMPASNVTVTAQWVTDPNAPEYEWIETALADLEEGDVFVIVGNNGNTYAMPSTLVSNTQPVAVSISILDDKIEGTVTDNLKWNVTGNSTDGYIFHPNGDATNYLYCNTTASTSSNTNMRIGTQNSSIRNLFVLEQDSNNENHLATKDEYTKRYVHLNGSTDWRGYVAIGTNSTTVKFYKRQVASNEPSITLSTYAINAPAEGATGDFTVICQNMGTNLDIDVWTCNATGESYVEYNWVETEVNGTEITYTIHANDGAARTAYLKVKVADTDAFEVYSSELLTITQAAPAPKYIATVASNISNGTVKIVDGIDEVDNIEVEEGAEIILTYTAEAGYALGEWNVYKDGDETVKVTVSNNKFNMPAYDVVISATFVEATTYTLITSIDELVSGKRYVIAGVKNSTTYAMGKVGSTNSNNNRVAVAVEINNNTIAGNNDVCEVVIIGPDADGFYSLYDVANTGYLYAASSSANNLKAQSTNNNNGRWTIEFEENAANIVAQGSNSRNILRFNNNGDNCLFSCYASGQQPIYLYAKNNETTVSYKMTINGYSNSTNPKGGYYLIASPFGQVAPTVETGFLAPDYDLYRFDQTQEQEWRNYKQQPFNLVSGHGYLYANSGNVTLTFEGYPYVGSGQVFLSYTEGNNWAGWNLIGNPFNAAATIPGEISYYTMNENGSDLTPGESHSVGAMEGIFVVKTTEIGQFVTFTQGAKANTEHNARLVLNLSSNSKLTDRAIIRFGEGQTLPKFMLNPEHTKLYITQEGTDYAVVRSNDQSEIPVSFKAAENGTYTISITINDIEMEQLHLIDNMTGANVDLLTTPSYTFEARTTDYASRFRLVFSTTGIEENSENASFAFYNGSEWVINASENATVEVVDMMGRVVLHTDVARNVSTSGMASGMYVMRLIDGNNVKTQKIVVE